MALFPQPGAIQPPILRKRRPAGLASPVNPYRPPVGPPAGSPLQIGGSAGQPLDSLTARRQPLPLGGSESGGSATQPLGGAMQPMQPTSMQLDADRMRQLQLARQQPASSLTVGAPRADRLGLFRRRRPLAY